jgi:hypothetical protein
MKAYFKVTNYNRQRIAQAVNDAQVGDVVKIAEPTRSLDQNAKLWPMLADISQQVDWYGQHLTDGEWKDVFTAALKKQKVVPGLDGGFVVCGGSTSKMTKREFSELIELMYAFGSDPKHPVQWSDESKRVAA